MSMVLIDVYKTRTQPESQAEMVKSQVEMVEWLCGAGMLDRCVFFPEDKGFTSRHSVVIPIMVGER